MRAIPFLVLAIFTATTASAAEWRMFFPTGHEPNRTIWFIDRSSVRIDSPGKRAWFQMINERPDAKGVASMKALVQLDCTGGRSRFLAIEMFGRTDLIGTKETPGEWSHIAPDSPIEALGHAICSNDYSDTMTSNAPPDVMARAAFETVDEHGRLKRQVRR